MLSPIRVVLAPEARLFTADLSPPTSIPLCDLRDLCAMLSPFRLFLAPEARLLTADLSPPTSIPLCDLRDLCAMLPRSACFSHQKPDCSPQTFRHQPQSPSVTSVT